MTPTQPSPTTMTLVPSAESTALVAAALNADFPAAPVSGDNDLVDSLRNIPMPEIDPMPPVHFAPIPLLSGVVLPDEGKGQVVNKVEVTITCEDGSTRTIELDERNGGWWVPKDRLDG